MKKEKKTTVPRIIWCTVVILVLGVLLLYPLFPGLQIASYKNPSNKILIPEVKADCSEERGFVISYTHSVNKGRVKDFYSVCKKRTGYVFFVNKTQYVSYGAGIPEPEGNEVFTEYEDYLEIRGIDRELKEFIQVVGLIADHAVEIGKTKLFLHTYFNRQEQLVFSYKKISFFEYMILKFSNKIIIQE